MESEQNKSRKNVCAPKICLPLFGFEVGVRCVIDVFSGSLYVELYKMMM